MIELSLAEGALDLLAAALHAEGHRATRNTCPGCTALATVGVADPDGTPAYCTA